MSRRLGLLGLAATGICSMLGAAINVIPFALQRSVPGIGSHVLTAYLIAAAPALLAAIAYAVLASAMPRAGGSYVFASRTISPYWGFVASFSQWFGLSTAIGVVAYVLIAFLRDIALALEGVEMAAWLETGVVRVAIALGFIWVFAAVNVLGGKLYERTLVPLMFLMFAFGSLVIFTGFSADHSEFIAAAAADGVMVSITAGGRAAEPLSLMAFLGAVAVLFSSFIGFDSIAQAGGEAKNPARNLPLAVGLAIVIVGGFYMLFTAAVYHAVPWWHVAEQAESMDVTAPGLLSPLLSPLWSVMIVAGAAVALINDLPAMLLAVSRLMFAWAADGIFPRLFGRVGNRFRTPHWAIVASACMASLAVLGCQLAGDFFLGVDILVTSMLVNFLLMCLAVLALESRHGEWASRSTVPLSSSGRRVCAGLGVFLLGVLLVVHVGKDLTSAVPWHLRSTTLWIVVMVSASLIYFLELGRLKRSGVDTKALFESLPPE